MPSSPGYGDQRRLWVNQGGSHQEPSTSDISTFHRNLSDDDNNSERDDQYLLSSGHRYQAGRTPSPQQDQASDPSNKEKLHELLSLMEKSQKQIQQLLQSQQAVREAVDDITPQDLPRAGSSRTNNSRGGLRSNARRDGSQRTTSSKGPEAYEASARSGEGPPGPLQGKGQPPIEDEYYQLNPWYGKPPDRPVFGLGSTLPHTIRGGGKKSNKGGSMQQDPEMGQGNGQESVQLFSLGSTLPHREGAQPVLQPQPTYSLARNLPHGRRGASKRDGQRPGAGGSGEPNEKAADDDEDGGYRTGTGGGFALRGDGWSQLGGDPFANLDRVGESYDTGERRGGGAVDSEAFKREQQRRNEGTDRDWAINAEPIGQYENEKEAETGEKDPNELRNWWARIRARHPEPLAEFLCTLVSIFLGISATLQVNLTDGEYGDYETACWAWGIAFMFGIYMGGGVSGAHMNPAISFSLWLFRGFPRRQMLVYWGCQLLACVCAAALAFGIFRDTVRLVDPELTETTASSFYSKPQSHVGPGTAFGTQLIAAAVMTTSVLALGDDQNNPPGAGLHAFVMGLLVTAQKMTLGANTGVALNPASDFGPRLVCLAMGYKTNMFSERGMWWLWGPWGATAAGSIVGCCLYDACIFVGSESPVNYKMASDVTARLRKIRRGLVGR